MAIESAITTGTEEGRFLLTVTGDIHGRIMDRLGLEHLNIPVGKVPIGQRNGIADIRQFWTLARDGFRWNLRMEDIRPWRGLDAGLLTKATRPEQLPDLSVFRRAFGLDLPSKPDRVQDPTKTPAYYTFRHIVDVLGCLKQRRVVSLEILGDDSAARLGELGTTETYWTRDIRPDEVWESMRQIETGMMQAIFGRGFVTGYMETMKAAHFFSTGEGLARRTLGN